MSTVAQPYRVVNRAATPIVRLSESAPTPRTPLASPAAVAEAASADHLYDDESLAETVVTDQMARGSSMESLRTTVDALQLRTAPASRRPVPSAHVEMQDVAQQDSDARSSASSESEIDMTVSSSSISMEVADTVLSASQLSRPKRKSAQHAAFLLQDTPSKGVPRKKKQKARAPMYVVQHIVKQRVNNKGLLEYLVRWEGYDSDECTWEPSSNIDHTDAYEAWRGVMQNKRRKLASSRRTPAQIAAASARDEAHADMDPFEFTE